ncbi:hypothetical protein LTR62_005234 [Meristemomyces frigidus]|uniref:Uncharacterized protein n=1 Tax=Meristemomyces frigidus TaxID=1508187 RepID=A0AAN7TFK9_9PEZI|nr:hypothetical protein LTR62_005234 [Meristemomyces frigidus]
MAFLDMATHVQSGSNCVRQAESRDKAAAQSGDAGIRLKGTAELLAAVLRHSSAQDVLRLQHVNREFRYSVFNSHPLYYNPVQGATATVWAVAADAIDVVEAPEEAEMTKEEVSDEGEDDDESDEEEDEGPTSATPYTYNPLLFCEDVDYPTSCTYDGNDYRYEIAQIHLRDTIKRNWQLVVTREDASCHRMHLTRPPITSITLYCSGHYQPSSMLRLHNENGVKFGELVRALRDGGWSGRDVDSLWSFQAVFVTAEQKRLVEEEGGVDRCDDSGVLFDEARQLT